VFGSIRFGEELSFVLWELKEAVVPWELKEAVVLWELKKAVVPWELKEEVILIIRSLGVRRRSHSSLPGSE
jgi:hypothetical protein